MDTISKIKKLLKSQEDDCEDAAVELLESGVSELEDAP